MWGKDVEIANFEPPKLMFTVFNGGKAVGSKVKFSRFYVIFDVKISDVDIDVNDMYFKVSAAIKKGIQAHKLGENGFKPGVTGAYYNAYENHNETFKVLEEAIASCNINTAERRYISIGINADAESSYQTDSQKYDIEGPKTLFDGPMLADWFLKQCNDHPLLSYIEDPFIKEDIAGYQKLLSNLTDKDVKVSVKSWFGSDLELIKEHTQLVQADSDVEEDEEEEEWKEKVEKLEEENNEE
jgi:enolase